MVQEAKMGHIVPYLWRNQAIQERVQMAVVLFGESLNRQAWIDDLTAPDSIVVVYPDRAERWR